MATEIMIAAYNTTETEKTMALASGGTDALLDKPASSNVTYDHGVATTGVHGVGAAIMMEKFDNKLDGFSVQLNGLDKRLVKLETLIMNGKKEKLQ